MTVPVLAQMDLQYVKRSFFSWGNARSWSRWEPAEQTWFRETLSICNAACKQWLCLCRKFCNFWLPYWFSSFSFLIIQRDLLIFKQNIWKPKVARCKCTQLVWFCLLFPSSCVYKQNWKNLLWHHPWVFWTVVLRPFFSSYGTLPSKPKTGRSSVLVQLTAQQVILSSKYEWLCDVSWSEKVKTVLSTR